MATISDVYGKRVRLKDDFGKKDEILQAVIRGDLKDFSVANDVPSFLFLPKGSEGIIAEGPYSGGLFDYGQEWPVQFDKFSKGEGVRGYSKTFTIGIPHELLEFVEEKELSKAKVPF
jgi:hypothetical protein